MSSGYRSTMRDYKPTPAKPQPRGRWLLWFIAGLGLPLVTVALIQPRSSQPPPLPGQQDQPQVSAIGLPGDATVKVSNAPAAESSRATEPKSVKAGTNTKLTVGPGDSLDYLFRRNNLSIADLTVIMRQDLARKHLRLIKPGDEINIRHDGEMILNLSREIDFARSLNVERIKDNYSARLVEHAITRRQVEAQGVIKDSLFLSAAEAGIVAEVQKEEEEADVEIVFTPDQLGALSLKKQSSWDDSFNKLYSSEQWNAVVEIYLAIQNNPYECVNGKWIQEPNSQMFVPVTEDTIGEFCTPKVGSSRQDQNRLKALRTAWDEFFENGVIEVAGRSSHEIADPRPFPKKPIEFKDWKCVIDGVRRRGGYENPLTCDMRISSGKSIFSGKTITFYPVENPSYYSEKALSQKDIFTKAKGFYPDDVLIISGKIVGLAVPDANGNLGYGLLVNRFGADLAVSDLEIVNIIEGGSKLVCTEIGDWTNAGENARGAKNFLLTIFGLPIKRCNNVGT